MNIPNLGVRFLFFSSLFFVTLAFAAPAHAQSINLIQNPGLETVSGTAPANWAKTYWGSPVPTFAYGTPAHSGAKAAKVTLGNNSTGDARWQHTAVTVEPGASYTYTIWYNSNVAGEIDAEFTSSAGQKTYVWFASIASSANTWRQATTTFTVPAGVTKASVYFLINKKGTLTIDDVSLTKNGTILPPPTPTLSFTASPTTVDPGAASTLNWSATNASTCTASGGWSGTKPVSGTQSVVPSATTTYSLVCNGQGGSVSKDVTVGVVVLTPPPSPTLTFFASPTTISQGNSSTLSWSSANTSSCTASGGWTGSKATSGSQSVSPVATTTYTLTCSGTGGNISSDTTVNITVPPSPSPGVFTEGMVTLSFDDAWLTQFTQALPILETANIKGTFYITTEPLQEGWDDFMTPANVVNIAQKGHEIAGHTTTHPSLPDLSLNQVNSEIINSKTYLQNLTGQQVTSLAYPYGEYNATVKSLVQQAGYTNARGVEYETANTATTDKFALKSQCIEMSDSIASIKVRIDAAKASKEWYILCFHEIKTNGDQWSTTPARLQEIVTYIKTTGIKTVTVQEGRALMTN